MMSTVADLIAQLNSPDATVWKAAVEALPAHGSDAVAPLIDTIQHGSGRQCWLAVKALGGIDDPRVDEALLIAITMDNPLLREAAVQEMGRRRSPAFVEVLIAALGDYWVGVQIWALDALGKIGDPRAIPPMLNVLADTQSATIRYTAIEALGSLGDPEVIPALLRYEDDPDHHVRSRVRSAVAKLRPTS